MQQALIETNLAQQPHRLTLDSRSRLSITGVLEVESFDDTEILLTSTRGPMSIRGQGLHLQQLSIDGGQVLVDGSVDAISYEDDIPRPTICCVRCGSFARGRDLRRTRCSACCSRPRFCSSRSRRDRGSSGCMCSSPYF